MPEAMALSAEDLSGGINICVWKALDCGPTESAAVDDRGVVQLVAEDEVALGNEGRDGPGIGGVTAGEQDGVREADELGERSFGFRVVGRGSSQEAGG